MRLLGIRTIVTGTALALGSMIVGTVAALISGDAVWLVVALQLVMMIGLVLALRAVRNVGIRVSETVSATRSEPLRYGPGEPLDLLRRDLQRDMSALLALHQLVDVPGRVPAPGGWAATPETLLALVSEIQRAPRVGTIVECGSGTSTIWMALALRQRGEGRLVSLEHDEEYAATTRRQLEDLGLADLVDLRVGPLSEQMIDGRVYNWFSDALIQGIDDVGLLFVDGPPGHLGSMIRFPAYPKLSPRLASGAIIVLDDIDRAEELAVLEAWQRSGPGGSVLQIRSMTDRAALLVYDAAELPKSVVR